MATVAGQGNVTADVSYEDLYARWERNQWAATAIDLTRDAVDWREKLTETQRRSALWLYSIFFHGEDSVADNLSPYVDAAPREEQTYFLTTQQVDEARHSVFFHRFLHEVVGLGDGTVGGGLRATHDQLTWGHRMVFGRLDRMADELRRDRSKVQLAKAVTLYHVIVEAMMAQSAQHMIEDYLERYDVLPGFREGMRFVSLDEQRHIAFGVKLLADLYAEDPGPIGEAIIGVIREVLPWVTDVPIPPGFDREYTRAWGFELEDLGETAARSLEQKLRAIGLPVDTMEGIPFDLTDPPRRRAEIGVALRTANFTGPGGPLDRSDENVRLFFDAVARQAITRHVRPGTTIQWEFSDFEPWHVVLADGRSEAQPGRVDRPSITFRSSFDDWVDLSAKRVEPAKLVLTGRVRARGNLLLLPKLNRVFG